MLRVQKVRLYPNEIMKQVLMIYAIIVDIVGIKV